MPEAEACQRAPAGGEILAANGSPDPYYYKYNTYHVQTDFEYIGLTSDLGRGWKVDGKVYTYRYWNKQYYNNPSVQPNGFFSPAASSITGAICCNPACADRVRYGNRRTV